MHPLSIPRAMMAALVAGTVLSAAGYAQLPYDVQTRVKFTNWLDVSAKAHMHDEASATVAPGAIWQHSSYYSKSPGGTDRGYILVFETNDGRSCGATILVDTYKSPWASVFDPPMAKCWVRDSVNNNLNCEFYTQASPNQICDVSLIAKP